MEFDVSKDKDWVTKHWFKDGRWPIGYLASEMEYCEKEMTAFWRVSDMGHWQTEERDAAAEAVREKRLEHYKHWTGGGAIR